MLSFDTQNDVKRSMQRLCAIEVLDSPMPMYAHIIVFMYMRGILYGVS